MMVSFVAALEGGYALENVLKISKEDTGTAGGEAAAEVGIPSLLGNLVKANLKGSGKIEGKVARSEESQIVLKHTEASLFMRLRRELISRSEVQLLDDCDEQRWSEVQPSSLVELSGYVLRSPISEIIRIAERMTAIMRDSLPWMEDNRLRVDKLTAEQRELIKFMNLVTALRTDIDSSPLSDMVMQHERGRRQKAVLNISSEILSFNEQERLLCGRVTVLGKATRILRPREVINVYRRSLFGYMAQESLEELQDQIDAAAGFNVTIRKPTVNYPALEIVPMAIYV